MRKLFLIFTISFFLAFQVLAATDSANLEEKKIENLKKKITEQTEKVKENLEKVVSGFIDKVEEDGFLLEEGEKVSVDPELTRYFEVKGNKIVEREKEEFEKGDYIFALGPVLDEKVNVLEVYKDEKFEIDSGVVVEVEQKKKFLRFLNSAKKEIKATLTSKTKLLLLTDEKKFEFKRVRISKVKEGDYLIIVYCSSYIKCISFFKSCFVPSFKDKKDSPNYSIYIF